VAKPMADDIDAEILFHDPIFVVAALKNRWTHRRKIALAMNGGPNEGSGAIEPTPTSIWHSVQVSKICFLA
jgi:hypothetical protein